MLVSKLDVDNKISVSCIFHLLMWHRFTHPVSTLQIRRTIM